MIKFVSLFVFVCILAFANAKNTNSNYKRSADRDIQGTIEFFNSRFNSTIFEDLQKAGETAKEKCPNIENKVESAVEEMQKCVEEIKIGSDTFCNIIRKNFARCTKPARDIVVSCLPEESRDLPIMAGKMILAFIDQTCKSTIEDILELFKPCIWEKNPESYPVCKEIGTTVNEYKSKLPSKTVICQTLPKLRNCAKVVLNDSCKNHFTQNAPIKFFDAINQSVKEECDILNTV